eukprot:SAG31_NODE_20065_length_584_cov_1.597938_2_plen_134_part_01
MTNIIVLCPRSRYYRQQGGRTLLGHNGCDWGTYTDTFYNPRTGAGFAVATSSDCDNSKAYRQVEAIEVAILDALESGRQADGYLTSPRVENTAMLPTQSTAQNHLRGHRTGRSEEIAHRDRRHHARKMPKNQCS